MQPTDLSLISQTELRRRKPMQFRCCIAAGCMNANGTAVKESLETAIVQQGLQERAEVVGVGCLRMCGRGPLVHVDPNDELYAEVTPDNAPALVQSLQIGVHTGIKLDKHHPFFANQVSVVLENCGRIDPERIESAIAAGAYQALAKAVQSMAPADVIEAISKSGLRGRGGAGYPTGVKWALVANTPGARKFVICNADEGDPGAFKDRTVLESDPHRVLEGMTIAGYATGARKGYIYVRGEYPLATHRLKTALVQARQFGILGQRVLDQSFAFDIEIRVGAGAYVCGEETALMASIEGARGIPRPRPPYPGEFGLWGCPTLINNVETFANIAPIIRNGADWFAGIGTPSSPGTKVFSLSGQVKNNGVIEVPMGTPLRQIVETMGDGAPSGRTIKAVQTGGPAGGLVPAQLLDTAVDYESMAAIGSIVGSGGMVVMDDTTDMVDVARYFMGFCRDESCGKCIPCRAGTVQMHDLLDRIHGGRGERKDMIQLEMLGDMVKHTSLCGLGQSAPNPMLSSLKHFREEYESRLRK